MNDPKLPPRSLAQIEAEVLEEGREWTRQRLQQRLQEEADRSGQVFPPQPTTDVARPPSSAASAHQRRRRGTRRCGTVVTTDTRRWGCPMWPRWGLSPHQQNSPLLEDKLAFTVTATGSYEQAAAVATRWGCPADDSTLHAWGGGRGAAGSGGGTAVQDNLIWDRS